MDIIKLRAALAGVYWQLPLEERKRIDAASYRCREWMPGVLQYNKGVKIDTLGEAARLLGYQVKLSIGDEWMDANGMRDKIEDLVLWSKQSMTEMSLELGFCENWMAQTMRNHRTGKALMKLETMEIIAGLFGYKIDLRLLKIKEDA